MLSFLPEEVCVEPEQPFCDHKAKSLWIKVYLLKMTEQNHRKNVGPC